METFTVTVTEMPGKVYGQYREGEIMTTIKDIARISGYSIGTVSRVINNRAMGERQPEHRVICPHGLQWMREK